MNKKVKLLVETICDDDIFNNDNNVLSELNVSEHFKNPDFVDLDLPSGNLWAIKNIGSKTPKDSGTFTNWRCAQYEIENTDEVIPTKDEFYELIKYTDNLFIYKEGIKFFGKNGNTLFIPVSGCKWYRCNVHDEESVYLWSNSISNEDRDRLYYLYAESYPTLKDDEYYDTKMPIRTIIRTK